MVVHAWTDTTEGFPDFVRFAGLLGTEAEVGRLAYSETANLWIGWIRGDDAYLAY
jgi:hypothetical protein